MSKDEDPPPVPGLTSNESWFPPELDVLDELEELPPEEDDDVELVEELLVDEVEVLVPELVEGGLGAALTLGVSDKPVPSPPDELLPPPVLVDVVPEPPGHAGKAISVNERSNGA